MFEDEILETKRMLGQMLAGADDVDAMFVSTFINEEMDQDFPFIAKEFLEHVGAHLSDYADTSYGEDGVRSCSCVDSIHRKILNAMLSAARQGDEYVVEMFRQMYKTYYRREYKDLKRFRSISYDELQNFDNEDELMSETMARILTICPFFQIGLEGDCVIAQKEIHEDFHDPDMAFPTQIEPMILDEKLFAQSRKEADRICGEDPWRTLRKCRKYNDFKENVLHYLGFSGTWDIESGKLQMGSRHDLAVTRSILKTMYPKKDFSDDELQTYLVIYRLLNDFTSQAVVLNDEVNMMMGRGGVYDYERERAAWKGVSQDRPRRTPKQEIPSYVVSVPETEENEDVQVLHQEIDLLKARLKSKEQSLKQAQIMYAELKRAQKENERDEETAADEHEELVTLRSYVYSLTQEDAPARNIGEDVMEESLRPKKIVIVGGHNNWISQLKEKFPDWKYINPGISAASDPHILNHAEMVYFFTDTISHGTYGIFIHQARTKNIPFGYIHSTNIRANISQIYADVCGKN